MQPAITLMQLIKGHHAMKHRKSKLSKFKRTQERVHVASAKRAYLNACL